MAHVPFLHRKSDQRSATDARPSEHGPAAARHRALIQEGLDELRDQLHREFAEGLDELRTQFRQEQEIRRARWRGIHRALGSHSQDIGTLAERVIRIEHGGPGPDGDEPDTSAARLRLVPAPRIPDLHRAA